MQSRQLPASVRITQIGPAEAPSAFALAREYFAAARVVVREDLPQFIAEYFSPGAGWWHATLSGQPIGCIGLHPIMLADSPSGNRCAEIKRMYVRKLFRGQGIAENLLHAAENFARQSGYRWVYLDTTDEMKAAARLYQHNGYEPCHRYNQNPQATIFMRKNISPDHAARTIA